MTRLRAALLVVVYLLGFAALAVSGPRGPFETLGLIPIKSGITAPDFTLADLNGNPVSLATPAGSATLLVFWGTW
ncbi:MAG: peroxiredoxin family protein [Candidatus Methylomirabilia bacterium]